MTEKEGWEYHVSGLCNHETCKHCQREAVFIKWSDLPGMAKSTKEKVRNRPKMSEAEEKKWIDEWSQIESKNGDEKNE